MKYIRNFSAHTDYEAEMSKIPTPSVSYCQKENECHFMPSNVIMFKVGDLNGNTNQTVTVLYYEGGSETIPITEGNRWYVITIPSGKILNQFVGNGFITDTIISARLSLKFSVSGLLPESHGNATLIGCDISELTSFNHLFYRCGKLISLTVDGLDTSNITDMNYAFYMCGGLKNLDLSTWVTSKVRSTIRMFETCKSLNILNISGWDLTNDTDMTKMFNECYYLKTIIMKGCNQTTIDKIKAQLEKDKLENVTIITE
jgi:surface protein